MNKKHELNKFAISDENLILIGLISVYYNWMIGEMKSLIRLVAKNQSIFSRIVLDKLKERDLSRVALELYMDRYGEDENLEKFKAHLRNFDKLISERNTFSHSDIFPSIHNDGLRLHKPVAPKSGEYKIRMDEIPTTKIKDLIMRYDAHIGLYDEEKGRLRKKEG